MPSACLILLLASESLLLVCVASEYVMSRAKIIAWYDKLNNGGWNNIQLMIIIIDDAYRWIAAYG